MGAAALMAAALAGTAAAVAVSTGGAVLRAAAVTPRPPPAPRADPADPVSPAAEARAPRAGPPRRVPAAVALAAVAVAWSFGGVVGVGLGLGLAVGLPRLLERLPDRQAVARDQELLAELPAALDLLAACLSAGCPLDLAVTTTADALDGPLVSGLRDVAAARRVGTPAPQAWARLAGPDPVPEVARAVGRAAETGVALAATLATLAVEQRRSTRLAGQARARRAAVLAVAPLGLCFLPAFALLGVVPVVVGIAQHVLG